MSERTWPIKDEEWVPVMFAAYAVRYVEPDWKFQHMEIVTCEMDESNYTVEVEKGGSRKVTVQFGPFRDACRRVCEPKLIASAAATGDLVASRMQAVLESIEATQREFHALEIKFSKLSDRLGQMHHRLAYMEHHFKIVPEEKP